MGEETKTKIPPSLLLGYVFVAIGLLCMAIGLSWNWVLPDEAFWSEEQARQYEQAYEAAHAATIGPGHQHPHGDTHEDHPEPLPPHVATDRFKQWQAKLNNASRARNSYGRWIAAAGAVLALGGNHLIRSHHHQPKR